MPRLRLEGIRVGTCVPYFYLGGGGGGVVYLATEYLGQHPIRSVAIKVVDVTVNSESYRNFLREVEVAGNVRHAHLLGALSFGEANLDGHHLMYMNMGAAETTLEDDCNRRFYFEIDGICVVKQVADALAYMHDVMGLVHGDVKPNNIAFSDGVWKLFDYGITRRLGEPLAGATHGFLAPEINRESFDPRAGFPLPLVRFSQDIYALGVSVARAFEPGWCPESALYEQTSLPKSIPSEVSKLVEACLREPHLRPNARSLSTMADEMMKRSTWNADDSGPGGPLLNRRASQSWRLISTALRRAWNSLQRKVFD